MAKNGNPTEQITVLEDVLNTNDKLERKIKQLQNEIKHQQNEIKDQQLIIKKFQERSKTAEKR
jgi:peptidoglycan hydrolase CwlO-like protein